MPPSAVVISSVSVLPSGKLQVDYEVEYPDPGAAASAALALNSAVTKSNEIVIESSSTVCFTTVELDTCQT